jgi:hypothetical protein
MLMKRTSRILLTILAAAVIALALFLVSCSKNSTGNKTTTPTWTVMMYGAGNNNLDNADNGTSYVVADVQDMELIGSSSNLNIVAMVSSARMSGGAKYYHIEQHSNELPNTLSSPVLENLGSQSMASPATLTNFINYCKDHYPAQHYLLVIDDHGAGWPGSCTEDLPGGTHDLMSMPDMKNAIANSALGRVDIVTFHACLMAMAEVAYELKPVADYMTACQFTMPMENVLGADLWLGWIRDNSGASTSDVAHKVCEKVLERARGKGKTTTYSMIKLSAMDAVGAKLGAFGNMLSTEGAGHWNEVLDAWTQTNTIDLDKAYYCDLLEFVSLIKLEPTLQNIPTIHAAADSLVAAINAAVIYKDTYCAAAPIVTRNGMNVHFPRTLQEFDSTNYVRLAFHGTNWQAFLSNFVGSIGPQDPTGRCCYNNNTACQDVTQAACNQLAGTWAQNLTCAGNPCQAGATCPATCATAQLVQLGETVNCQFSAAAQDTVNWFGVSVVAQVNYRFELCGFTDPVDYDLFFYGDCASAPLGVSQEVGCENATGSFTGTGVVGLKVLRFAGSGPYFLRVTQIGEPQLSNERVMDFGKPASLPAK